MKRNPMSIEKTQRSATAFDGLDILRITGLYYEPNTGSKRVLEKAGFVYEGTMKNAVVKNGGVYNLCIMGLLKEN